MRRVLRSSTFWIPFLLSLLVSSVFFGWELGWFNEILPSLPRPPAPGWEVFFSVVIGLLLSVNIGLVVWQKRHGSCPTGVRSATGVAGLIGAFTLICPVCVLLPASLIGIGFIFSFLGPFLPLLRIIAVILLAVSTWMLRVKKK